MGAITKTKVYINGIGLPLAQSFNWTHPPGPVEEWIPNISDPFERPIPIKENYAEGDFEIIAQVNGDCNDPLEMMDVLGFNDSYSYFDTSTESVLHSSTVYNFTDEASGAMGRPQVPIELRQTNADAVQGIENDASAINKVAFRFKAMAEDLHSFSFKAYDISGLDVTSVILEVWSDSSGDPDAKVASTNTVTETGMTITDGTGVGDADWETITDLEEGAANDLLNGQELTVGDWYWIVIEANSANLIYIAGSTTSKYKNSDMQRYDDNDSSWKACANSIIDPCFILQGYHKYGGHTVDIREYTTDESNYIRHLCQASNVVVGQPNYAPQKATRITFKFTSNKAVSSKV